MTGEIRTSAPPHPASASDYLPREELRSLQAARLADAVRRAFECVPYHRERLRAAGVEPDSIRSLDDLRRLPFIRKPDLRALYPLGLLAVPREQVARIHMSSGTTGTPIVAAYTREDLDLWAGVMARTLAACGVRPGDVVQNAYGYGLFTGGLGVHYGAERLGATVLPMSGGQSERQIRVMRDFGTTVICSTPSYFLHLADQAEAMGVSLRSLRLRVGVFGAEPWTETMRRRIEEVSGLRACDIYGLTEIIGPGVASECEAQSGLHVFEDHFYPEIIDPETGEVLPDGEEGELVLTTLTKAAMPMLRYRTGDLTALIPEPCACGRTLRRMRRVRARSDDMLIVRGVNVFPSQIEAALLSVEGTLPHYLIVLRRERHLDVMEVQVEVTAEHFSDRIAEMQSLERRIAHAIEQATGLRVGVRLVEPRTLQRSEGKARRVQDLRGQE